MKGMIFTFLFMATSVAMFAQIEQSNGLQTQLVETWVNGAWQNSMQGTFTSDEGGYITNVLFETWDVDASIWETDRKVSYSSAGNTQTELSQNWDGENWANTSKTTWYYSGEGEPADSMIIQLWADGEWLNQQQVSNTYDDAGYLINALYETWNAENAEWQTASQMNYTLNGEGQAELIITQIYISGAWLDYQRQTNTYTDGLLTYSLYEFNNPPSWVNSSEMTHSYDDENRIHQVLMNVWNVAENSWNTASRITYFYETLGLAKYDKNAFSFYPNPATDKVTISSEDTLTSVKLYSIDGRSYSPELVGNRMDISSLPQGVYILSAETGKGRQNVKLIKQ